MHPTPLHSFHAQFHARFLELDGEEAVANYGDTAAEYRSLTTTAGLIDLTCRGRVCLTGGDRVRFLHGQVTNDVNALQTGEGCYAALITAKGKMVSDLNVYRLENELLLDFEPGLTGRITGRLEEYIIADDVQVIDVSGEYGLLSIQGPRAADAVKLLGLTGALPQRKYQIVKATESSFGEVYIANQARLGTIGFDVFVPASQLQPLAEQLLREVMALEGRMCGWEAFEICRVEAGIPRFGLDMDETNLAPEAGIESGAISYKKGCYIGQEIIARIRTYGQVARLLRRLKLPDDLQTVPKRGDKLFKDAKEVGFITSAVASPITDAKTALGYVRREANAIGTVLILQNGPQEIPVSVAELTA